MTIEHNESARRLFVDVPINELGDAVTEMCIKLGISNSGTGDYNLSALVINYQSEIKEKLLRSKKAFDDMQ